MMYSQNLFISNIDALPIHGHVWAPKGKPSSIVVIAHGMAEHALRYERFAKALTDVDILVWAIDHRAHGKTSGPNGLGDFGEAGWDGLVSDLGQFIKIARNSYPELPILLFGHSMGSTAAQSYIIDFSTSIDGLILSGATAIVGGKQDVNKREEKRVEISPSEFSDKQFDSLSRDKVEVDRYKNDPLCGFELVPDSLKRMFDSWGPLTKPDVFTQVRSDLPILFIAGDKDLVNQNLTGLDLLEKKFRDAGINRIDKRYYHNGRHEMLNELNRDEVTIDIINWIRRTLGGP